MDNETEVPLEDAPQYLVGANELKMALSGRFALEAGNFVLDDSLRPTNFLKVP